MQLMPEKIRRARMSLKLRAHELAKLAQVDNATITRLHRPKGTPSIRVLLRVAKALGESVSYLLDDELPFRHPELTRPLTYRLVVRQEMPPLQQLRRHMGFSLMTLAKACGLSVSCVARLESGKVKKVKDVTLDKLGQGLNLGREELRAILKRA